MSIGHAVDVCGVMLREGRRTNLYVDGGGYWELDLLARHLRFVGQRVRVQGVRSGFNRIDVERLSTIAK